MGKSRAEASGSSSEENEEENSNDDGSGDDGGESVKGLKETMTKAEEGFNKHMDVFYKAQLMLAKKLPRYKLRKLKVRSPYPQKKRQKLTTEQKRANMKEREQRNWQLHGDALGDDYYSYGGASARGGTTGNW